MLVCFGSGFNSDLTPTICLPGGYTARVLTLCRFKILIWLVEYIYIIYIGTLSKVCISTHVKLG